MDSHVFHPWQIRELVLLLDLELDRSEAWCLGHTLVHNGVVSVVDDRLAAVDFDDADGLWRALASAAVAFAGKWAEVADATLAHARRTGESVSFLYHMCFVCARDQDPTLRGLEPLFINRLRVDPARLLESARRGVVARGPACPGKRKAEHEVYTEAFAAAPFLQVYSERNTAPRIARETPSAWA
mgnify:CR=1 FL=1